MSRVTPNETRGLTPVSPRGWLPLELGLSRLEFQSHAVIEGVALGLLHVHQHILFPLRAVRILHRRIHLAEDAQIIEALLGVQHVDLTQRIARLDLDFTLHDKGAGVNQSGR